MSTALPPGSTVGVIGGGQLGRMMCIEARRLGFRTLVLDPDPQAPAAQVADETVVGALSDADAMREMASRVQVATYEFENIDPDAVDVMAALVPVHPSSAILRLSQHRVREKEALAHWGAPVPRFYSVQSRADLEHALARLGFPAVMKTATGGYDGKGQALVRDATEAHGAYDGLRPRAPALILEEWVDLALEVSVICARDRNGRVVSYPTAENRHKDGILDLTVAPARIPPALDREAQELARGLAVGWGLVGVLAVEMFVGRDGRLLVNEIAPRPHNSGHYTWEACPTSQFEQLVRVVTGLPLGSTSAYRPAAMANLMGDLWQGQVPPDFARMLEVPGVRLHLYGKATARPGRKMGHLACLADTPDEALARVERARERGIRSL